jgi:hypothetical protein
MNAVGMLYREGLGVDENKAEAAKWFEKAGKAGYATGWGNLAIMYHYGVGIPQDYAKAYQSYTNAANLGDAENCYCRGYMLYKGLGCVQNYDSAVALFRKAADAGSASGMYFLGLCYRNGYGIARDTILARHWMTMAAGRNVRDAADELAAGEPEYVEYPGGKPKAARYADTRLPKIYKKISHSVPNANVAGEYAGYIVKYDWSGKYVIDEAPLALTLVQNGKTITGQWIERDSISATIEAELSDSALVFTRTEYRRTDHYHRTVPRLWNFTRASLNVVQADTGVYMAGNMQFYSPETKEPDKPMYISLTRVSRKQANKYSNSEQKVNKQKSTMADTSSLHHPITSSPDFAAYPNPFSNDLNVSFTLQSSCEVRLAVISLEGRVLQQLMAEKLDAGQHLNNFSLNVQAGIYIVKLYAGNNENSIIVVKQ